VDSSAEFALEDAETLLMHAKKEVLVLEMKLHDALKQKSDCVSELARAREELRQDGRDLGTATEAVARAVSQVELEHALSDQLKKLADLQADHLSAAKERARQFESVITTGEGLRVVNGEIVKGSILQEELDEMPEYDELRKEHNKQLKLLKEATSEEELHHFVVLADRADQLSSEVRAIAEELEHIRGPLPYQPYHESNDAFGTSSLTGKLGSR
jgi:small-conductance mechanosensitive channel